MKRLIATLLIFVSIVGMATDQRIHSKYKRGVWTFLFGEGDTVRIIIDSTKVIYQKNGVGVDPDSMMFYDPTVADSVSLYELLGPYPGGDKYDIQWNGPGGPASSGGVFTGGGPTWNDTSLSNIYAADGTRSVIINELDSTRTDGIDNLFIQAASYMGDSSSANIVYNTMLNRAGEDMATGSSVSHITGNIGVGYNTMFGFARYSSGVVQYNVGMGYLALEEAGRYTAAAGNSQNIGIGLNALGRAGYATTVAKFLDNIGIGYRTGYDMGYALTGANRQIYDTVLLGKFCGNSLGYDGTGNIYSIVAIGNSPGTNLGYNAAGINNINLVGASAGHSLGETVAGSAVSSINLFGDGAGFQVGNAGAAGAIQYIAAFGTNALYQYDTANTPTNVLGLGYGAGYQKSGDNKLYISGSLSKDLVTGDFANDSLTINGTLHVRDSMTVSYIKLAQSLFFDEKKAIWYKDGFLRFSNALYDSVELDDLVNDPTVTPGGISGNVQYNDGGAFNGFGNWDGSRVLSLPDSNEFKIGNYGKILWSDTDGSGKVFTPYGTGVNSLFFGPRCANNFAASGASPGNNFVMGTANTGAYFAQNVTGSVYENMVVAPNSGTYFARNATGNVYRNLLFGTDVGVSAFGSAAHVYANIGLAYNALKNAGMSTTSNCNNNIAIGYEGGKRLGRYATGVVSNNVIIGATAMSSAGEAASKVSNNAAIGTSTLYQAAKTTTGELEKNVIIGGVGGYELCENAGSGNIENIVGVGYATLYEYSLATAVNNVIAIGPTSGYQKSGSNKLWLGVGTTAWGHLLTGEFGAAGADSISINGYLRLLDALYFAQDADTYIDSDGDDLQFTDATVGTITTDSLRKSYRSIGTSKGAVGIRYKADSNDDLTIKLGYGLDQTLPGSDSLGVAIDTTEIATVNSVIDSLARITLGEGYIAADSTIVANVADKYYAISFEAGDNVRFTASDDSTWVVPADGYYALNYSVSGTHATNNTIITSAFFVDDVENTQTRTLRKIGTGGDVGNYSGTGIDELDAGDELKLKIKSDKTGNITISTANANIFRIR